MIKHQLEMMNMYGGICDKCEKYTIVSQYKFWFLCDKCLDEIQKRIEKKLERR